jgi:preprotein translocase subunit YajC
MTALLELSGILAQTMVQDERASRLFNFGVMAFMVLAMYLLLFRPQQKKARDHANMLKTIKNGDKVVTSGGVLGVVVGLKDKSVSIRSADTKLEVLKTAVTEIVERGGSSES